MGLGKGFGGEGGRGRGLRYKKDEAEKASLKGGDQESHSFFLLQKAFIITTITKGKNGLMQRERFCLHDQFLRFDPRAVI